MDRLNTTNSLTQLSYLDEVSSVILQKCDINMFKKLQANNFNINDEYLLIKMGDEWKSSEIDENHWAYVMSSVPLKESQKGLHDVGHYGWTLQMFSDHPMAIDAELTLPDIVALRLYTGEGFRSINASLRKADGNFTFTVFCANRAIGKLAHLKAESTFPNTYYRGMKGRVRIPFKNMYNKIGTDKAIGRICDCGLFSTTADISIATEKYRGEILFIISGAYRDGNGNGGYIDEEGYEMMSTPAPVQWISQYPDEAEYLWPTFTAFIPKPMSERKSTRIDGKEIYEFTPVYLWDTTLKCIGRYSNIEESDLEMAQMANQFAPHQYGLQDIYMAVPGLFINHEIDEDFEPADAFSVAFSLFDRNAVGYVSMDDILEVIRVFYSVALNESFGSRVNDDVKYPPLRSTIESVKSSMEVLSRDDGFIHWSDFRNFYSTQSWTQF